MTQRESSELELPRGGASGAHDSKRKRFLAGLAILVFSFALYGASLLLVDYSFQDDVYFGADHGSALPAFHKRGALYKHNQRPLFGLVAGSLFVLATEFLTVSDKLAAATIFALLGSLAIWLLYYILQRFFSSTLNAALISCCYALSFANVVVFGIPESYSLSASFILLLFLSIFELMSRGQVRPIAVGVLGGISGWTNPVAMYPLGSYVLLLLKRFGRAGFRIAFVLSAIAVSVFLIPSLIGYSGDFEWKVRYLDKWGSVWNLLDLQAMVNVLADIFFFSVVTPYAFVLPAYVASDIAGYIVNPLRLAAITVWICILILTIFWGKRESSTIVLSLAGPLIPVFFFFVYLNPVESMLYTPLTLVVLFLLIGVWAGSSRLASAILAVFAILLALTNVPPLYKTSNILAPQDQSSVGAAP